MRDTASRPTFFAAIRREAASFVVLAALILSVQALLPTLAAAAPSGTPLAELCLGTGGNDGPAGKVGHIGFCVCGTICAHACCEAMAAAPAIVALAAAARISARHLPSGVPARRSRAKSAHRSRGAAPPLLIRPPIRPDEERNRAPVRRSRVPSGDIT